MQFPLPLSEIPQDFDELEFTPPPAPGKTYFTKEEILAPCHPYAKPPVVSEATARVLLAACVPMACVLIAEPLWKALRAWKRPQFALQHLLVLTFALAGALLGGVGIWQAKEAEKGPVAELQWAQRIEAEPGTDLVATFHRDWPDGLQKFSLYAREGSLYRHEKSYFSEWDCWFEPAYTFRYRKGGVNGTFLIVTHRYSGTGCYKEEAAFLIRDHGHLDEIQFDDATECLEKAVPISPDEGVWKPPHYLFSNEGLGFEFWIWKSDDGNCCPTAGAVTGTYKIVRYGGRLRLMVDQAVRGPVEYDQ